MKNETLSQLAFDQMADAFAEIERHPLPASAFMAMSIGALQELRPDLTDEILAETYDIIRGRDFVTLHDGKILRGVMV
jgi:hypothetical protein